MEKNTKISFGGGSISLLTIAFIVLKLCGVISWSWFWVLSPIIFAIGLVILLIILYIVLNLIFG